jgi:hypothetical protein
MHKTIVAGERSNTTPTHRRDAEVAEKNAEKMKKRGERTPRLCGLRFVRDSLR